MSYTNAADWISSTIGTVLTTHTVKSGEGLDYENFIQTGSGKANSVFVTLDSIIAVEYYENANDSLYSFTTRIYIRSNTNIYANVQSVINYYAGVRYTDKSGNKIPVSLVTAMPSREFGRQVWELEFLEIRGLI